MTSSNNNASVWDYLTGTVTEVPRAVTSEELVGFIGLHDRILAGHGISGVQLVHPRIEPGEAGAAIARLIFPIGAAQNLLVVALYCAAHTPGTPLASSQAIGRDIDARVFTDDAPDAPGAIWGEAPAIIPAPQDFH